VGSTDGSIASALDVEEVGHGIGGGLRSATDGPALAVGRLSLCKVLDES